MFKLLIRVACFFAGVLFLLDAGLPTTTQEMHVDGHTSHIDTKRWNTSHDTSYSVKFVGGRLNSCSVGYSAYNQLNDGDTVTIKSSKILGECIRIERADQEVYQDRFWKIFRFVGGLLLLAVAFGWIESTDDDEERGGVWFRFW
jgi:hypothetical protein